MRYDRLCAFALSAVSTAMAVGQTYTVSNTNDSGTGSLRQAIVDANAFGGAASINFTGLATGSTINIGSMLPILTNISGISIDGGNRNITINGATAHAGAGDRVFFIGVAPGTPAAGGGNLPSTSATSWSISNLTIAGGHARGGNGGDAFYGAGGGGAGLGGGVFVNAGTLTLTNVAFTGNRAAGGAGGSFAELSAFAGGGGGMGGAGGSGFEGGSGGGGGFGVSATGGTGFNHSPGANLTGSAGAFTGAEGGGTGGVGGVVGGANGGGGGGGYQTGGGGGGGVGGQAAAGSDGGVGGFGGGGGGGNEGGVPGNGGYGGGGGGFSGYNFGVSGFGGFGGGAGGNGVGAPGHGGGASSGQSIESISIGGGGGLGAGGAVFVRETAAIVFVDGSISGGLVTGGAGGLGSFFRPANAFPGQAWGSGIYVAGNAFYSYSVSAGNTSVIADNVSGNLSGGFNKIGAGTLVLSGANDYSGGTTVSAGTLLINGTLAGPPFFVSPGVLRPAAIVKSGGTLGGSGTISGGPVTVEAGGHLAPGNSPGILTIDGLIGAAGAFFDAELNGTTAGTGHDQLNVFGTVNLGGMTLDAELGYAAALGDVLVLINNDGGDAVIGTFAGLADGATVDFGGGASAIISYVGGTGNDVTLSGFIVPVPEPRLLLAAALLGLALLGVLRRRPTRAV